MQMPRSPESSRRSGRGATVIAIVVANLISIAVKVVLYGGIGAFLLILLVTGFTWLGVARRRSAAAESPSAGKLAAFHSVVCAFAAGLLLVGVLITPFASYTEWIRSFAGGTNSEASHVSGLFTLIISFFTVLIVPTAVTMGPMWVTFVMALVLAFVCAVIFKTALAFCLVFAAAAVCVSLLALKRSVGAAGITRTVRVVFPLIAGGFAVGIGALFMNVSTEGPKDFVDNTVSPALRRSVLSVSPRFPLLYDISRTSDEFKQKQLGGSPTLTSTPIFEIQGRPGETVYVRTDVLDSYNGSSWTMSNRILRSGDRFRRSVNDSDTSTLRITPLVGNMDLLPVTLDTVRVTVSGEAPPVEEGNFDTGFHLKFPLKKGQTVQLVRSSEISEQLRDDLRPYYLQIPDELPATLRSLADGLRQDTVTGTLNNIQRFLAFNYSYNLTPDQPYSPSEDFVYSFLLSPNGGYCVQFATTFVILARLNGIPARYATGYLAYIPKDSDKAQVTELASHSWPEVWIDGRGWVTYEATTAVDPANYVLNGNNLVYQYGIDSNPNTERQLQAILGHSITTGAGSTVGSTGGLPPAVIAAMAVVAAALAFLLVFFWVRGSFNPFRDRRDRVYSGLRILSRRLVKYGVPNPVDVGWSEWTEHITAKMNGSAAEVKEMSAFVMLNLYAERPLPEDALRRVRRTSRSITREMKILSRPNMRGSNGERNEREAATNLRSAG